MEKKDEKFNKIIPKIYPVLEEEPDPRIFNKPIHPNMIQPYSLVIGVGQVKSGKTCCINNIMLRTREEGFLDAQDTFDQSVIISNTIGNDPSARFLKKAFEVQDHYTDGYITKFIQKQDSYGEKKDMPYTCMILDDILGRNMKRNNDISFLATRYRHKNIGLLGIFVQNYKSLDTILRNNCTDWLIYKQTNTKSFLQIAEELHGVYGSMENFVKLYKYATSVPYGFLYLKIQDGKALRSFEEVIFEDGKMLIPDSPTEKDIEKIINPEKPTKDKDIEETK